MRFFKLILTISLMGTCLLAHAENPADNALVEKIRESRLKIPELAFAAEEAKKLGVRLYLAGGGAASLANFLNTQPGGQNAVEYENVFRLFQDIDLVVDGSSEIALKLEEKLRERFPRLLGENGTKSVWEVTLLRQDNSGKPAKLGNPEFLQQNNDSLSLAAIELTDPPLQEPLVRDFRSWNQGADEFLASVRQKKIVFHTSPAHKLTSFYKEGRNPEILSVVRVLQKAFQFNYDLDTSDLEKVRRIVGEFNPSELLAASNPYPRNWLATNAKKMLLNTSDLNRSWTTLQQLGLTRKLIQLDPNGASKPDSLGWWMNKVPLPDHPVGNGSGKTWATIASEKKLGASVFHYTNSAQAVDAIAGRPTPFANAFMSRAGAVGERNVMTGEDAFFVTTSARNIYNDIRGGFEIEFAMNPQAKEGTDFFLLTDGSGTHLGIKNRNALILKKRPADLLRGKGLIEMLRTVDANPEEYNLSRLQPHLGRWSEELKSLSPQDRETLSQLLNDTSKKGQAKLQVILELPQSRADETVTQLLDKTWNSSPESERILGKLKSLSQNWYDKNSTFAFFKKFISQAKSKDAGEFLYQLGKRPFFKDPYPFHEAYIEKFREEIDSYQVIAMKGTPHLSPEQFDELFRQAAEYVKKDFYGTFTLLANAISDSRVKDPDKYLLRWIRNESSTREGGRIYGETAEVIIRFLKQSKNPYQHKELIRSFINTARPDIAKNWLASELANPNFSRVFPEIVEFLKGSRSFADEADSLLFKHSHWRAIAQDPYRYDRSPPPSFRASPPQSPDEPSMQISYYTDRHGNIQPRVYLSEGATNITLVDNPRGGWSCEFLYRGRIYMAQVPEPGAR